MPCYAYQGLAPVVDATSYIHPLASLIGDVFVGPGCFIGPGASLRGDFGRIVVEGDSSLQDNATVHANQLRDTLIRRGATIAHGAVVHGCEIGENSLIGMNAVILDEAVIGPENLVAALALVKSDVRTPARSLVVGNPAMVVKTFAPHEVTWRNDGDGEYQRLARAALTDLIETAPLRHADDARQAGRVRSDAVAVRLSGDTAGLRQRRSATRAE
jgi:carbonic anhydrase/acetyltransferase-like protein (isoleucine patch superfamily)